MSENDPFFERENKKQIDRLLERARSGDVFAVYTFAEYLHEGIMVDKDVAAAAKWYKLAAAEGHAGAIEKLNKMFVNGEISEMYVPAPYIPPQNKKSSTTSFFNASKKSSDKPRKKIYDGNFGNVDAGLSALFNDERGGYEEKTFHFKESYNKNKRRNIYDYEDSSDNDDD